MLICWTATCHAQDEPFQCLQHYKALNHDPGDNDGDSERPRPERESSAGKYDKVGFTETANSNDMMNKYLFNYVGCNISYGTNIDWDSKLTKFRHICETIHRYLKNKTRKDTRKK